MVKVRRTNEPNEEQQKIIKNNKLQPDNWQVISENKAELEIRSRRSGRRKTLKKIN